MKSGKENDLFKTKSEEENIGRMFERLDSVEEGNGDISLKEQKERNSFEKFARN